MNSNAATIATTYQVSHSIMTVRRNQSLLRTLALAGWAVLVMSAATGAASAEGTAWAATVHDGKGTTGKLAVGENTEKATAAADPGAMGFSISVDGERIAGDDRPVDAARRTDIDLSRIDIQVKFDGLGVKPMLNVSTDDLRHSYMAGEIVTFVSTMNYPAWIERAEMRIFDASHGIDTRPLDVIAVKHPTDRATWRMPAGDVHRFAYVLRVYDKHGRFDETVPLELTRTSRSFATHQMEPEGKPVSAGNGEDRTAFRNIPIYGGAITVYGKDVPRGYRVQALSETIPIDNNGAFVVQRILPPGEHSVDVRVSGVRDGDLAFTREVSIPENEWFYVALADLTVGHRLGSKDLVAAGPGEYKSTYTKGRLAFYLKGKIKGRYLLTAAADTGEDKVENLFRNLDAKGPQDLLRRIDPEKFYPVYGDDGTIVEDAPTDGKFYVRLERDDSHIMWGRYKTTIRGTEFARNERSLYGAHARYRSENSTRHGERRFEVEAYVSKPGTLPQRDNMRGTGGSLYFLSRQDVNRNSETIFVEVRDRVSGIVLSRQQLIVGTNYDINYLQGVVILKQPLASTTARGTIISDGSLGGDSQYLVAQYEYTPALADVKGYSGGGRGQAWLTDNVRFGVSGLSEKTGQADQKVVGADARVRLGPNSYVEGEVSRSSGPGFGSTNSLNGGLTIDQNPTAGRQNRTADAYRAKMHLDLEDLNLASKGVVGFHYEWRGAGFSSIGYDTLVSQRTFGAHAKVEVNERLRYQLKYTDYQDAAAQKKQEGDAEVEFDIDKNWSIGFGIKHTDVESGLISTSNGARTDAGSRLTYKVDEHHKYYVFGQGTLQHSGQLTRNDRGGIGGEVRLTEKVGLKGEVSYGTLGWGGLAAVTYDPTADDHNYIGYRLDPDRLLTTNVARSGLDRGGIVVGAKHKYSESLSGFGENNYDSFGDRRSLTSTYGVIYTPDPRWSVTSGVEYGDVKDITGADLERVALSGSVVYKADEHTTWRLKGEARFEDSVDAAQDRDTYLIATGYATKYDDNWRFLSSFEAAISNSDQSAILDGDYLKASVGYAYRPVDNDRLNAVFKYIFLYDLPGPDQITSYGTALGPAQRSHVLSADVSYDLNKYLTIGGKYGFRIGEVSDTRSNKDFVASSAHLGVVRADFHVVKNWDVMAEARVLHTPEIDTTMVGFVAGIYRHVGSNMKVGVGYNFGRFSDDVADLKHDDRGVFVNVVGKF